jgi:hypothetical protein
MLIRVVAANQRSRAQLELESSAARVMEVKPLPRNDAVTKPKSLFTRVGGPASDQRIFVHGVLPWSKNRASIA